MLSCAFENVVSDAALETGSIMAILAVELEECLALGGIGRLHARGRPAADDGVVLGRKLGKQRDGLILVLLLTMDTTIDEEQRHPGIDDEELGLHTPYALDSGTPGRTVELVMIVPVIGGLLVE